MFAKWNAGLKKRANGVLASLEWGRVGWGRQNKEGIGEATGRINKESGELPRSGDTLKVRAGRQEAEVSPNRLWSRSKLDLLEDDAFALLADLSPFIRDLPLFCFLSISSLFLAYPTILPNYKFPFGCFKDPILQSQFPILRLNLGHNLTILSGLMEWKLKTFCMRMHVWEL